MNRSIRIVSTLVLVSSIISCKKNSNSESNKTRLSKMMQWNSAAPSKGIITNEFIYDDQKRLVEIATFTGDSVGGEIKSAKNRSFKCLYNGKETNPYKTIGYMSYYPNTAAEIFHTYNSSGQLLQDSIPTSSTSGSRIIRTYNYMTDKIVVQIQEKSSYYVNTSRDSFLLADHNLKEAYLGVYQYQSTGYKMGFDDKNNPISKLNIAALTTTGSPFGFPSFLAPGYCKNNISEFAMGYSYMPGNFTSSNIFFYTYTYNSGNLPTECRFATGNSTSAVKFQYID